MAGQEKRQRKPAIGYTRTSSAANVGDDKDSVPRQRKAIEAYAKRAGYRIVSWFDDPAVKGEDAIDTRPGFAAALERIAGNGVRTIIVETANRFARDLIVQETGFKRLQAEGITLIAADKPDSFVDDTPTAVLVRQILGAVAQFDKAMTVAKLRGARERKRRKTGARVEGRKTLAESHPEAVAMARQLREQSPRMSLREISAALASEGIVTKPGKGKKRPGGVPYTASAVASMLAA
ncbi:serine recombinase [Bradyrhizobium sp. NAS80.1]|uniref:recombinase family protein n=1 Tax=Bradyrhizobium sp. NAS80.1 TaxID=1680159 RepID=UPI00095F5316|nr:recombinase family protein [Bradyrhizobium sp. NAS80.1]OKO70561.1 serine recombinase [Bradyrhizobium sp. NAS80.1]